MVELSLAQEYFLCALGNKGRISSMDLSKMTCLVASGVLELWMDGLVNLDGNQISLQAPLPEEKRYLRSLYELIDKKQPVKMETIAQEYSFTFTDRNINRLMEDIGESLEKKECIRKETGGLFGGKIYYYPDPLVLDGIIQNIRAELLEQGTLSHDIIALASLLDKTGDISQYFSAYEKTDLKARLKEIRTAPEYQVIKTMLDYIELLFIVAVT